MNKAIPVGIVVVIVIAAYFLGFRRPAAPSEEEVASLWIDSYVWIGGAGNTLCRFGVRNNGTVAVKVSKMDVKGKNVEYPVIEGAQIQARVMRPGETAELDVGLTEGAGAPLGEYETLTVTIETDRGNFRFRCGWTSWGEYIEW